MSEVRTCVDCGNQYIFDAALKKGATTRCCSTCARRNAKQETKRLMLEAAGGACRSCGYKRSLDAITFIDPIARFKPVPNPVNREEKIEWASQRIAICLNCAKEVEGRYVIMHIEDSKVRPPRVTFATDVATIIEKSSSPFTRNTSLSIPSNIPKEIEIEILPP